MQNIAVSNTVWRFMCLQNLMYILLVKSYVKYTNWQCFGRKLESFRNCYKSVIVFIIVADVIHNASLCSCHCIYFVFGCL